MNTEVIALKMRGVLSGFINAIGWEDGVLEIWMKKGYGYRYHGVTEEQYHSLFINSELVETFVSWSLICRLLKDYILVLLSKGRAGLIGIHLNTSCTDDDLSVKHSMLKQESGKRRRKFPQFGKVLFVNAIGGISFCLVRTCQPKVLGVWKRRYEIKRLRSNACGFMGISSFPCSKLLSKN